MKVTVLQENLAQGINIVSRAVSPRSTLPVLANVLAATDDGRLRLSATNLELGITCWIGAKIEREGSTTIPARTFSDLVSTLPKDRVEMDLTEQNQSLHVKCGTSNTDIKCIDAQEFPPMPALDATRWNPDECLRLKGNDPAGCFFRLYGRSQTCSHGCFGRGGR
ncbi:MAG: hypothetical protein HC806_01625 [Anaerolineae bacterium]|nr:hypothetical protein [Anaerolineae bacterium]